MNQLGPISVTDIIRLLEEIIHVADVKPVIRSYQSLDQFAYREGTNTSQGLIKSEHMWLKWLDTGEQIVLGFLPLISPWLLT